MLILPTCGCCWLPLGCLLLWGLTMCGSALHPSVVPAQQGLDMSPYLLEMESAEAAAEVGSLLRAELDSKVWCCDGLWVTHQSPLHPILVSCTAQKGTGCWSHWWSCWSSTFCTCSGHLFVVYKLTPVGSCSNNRFCSERQNNSTPNRRAAVLLILTGTVTIALCRVQHGRSQCAAWRGGSTGVGRHCQTSCSSRNQQRS